MTTPLIVVVVSVSFCSLARAQSFWIWNEADITAASPSVRVVVPLVDRIAPSAANPQFLAAGVTADVRLPAGTAVTVGYLFVDLPQRQQSAVHVPLLAISNAVRLGRLMVADRNRIEKLIGLGPSPIRYRNRLSLDCPLGTSNSRHVFTDEEVFFDAAASEWTQSRFRIGAGRALGSTLALDVFYLQQGIRGRTPNHVLGTTLKVAVRKRART